MPSTPHSFLFDRPVMFGEEYEFWSSSLCSCLRFVPPSYSPQYPVFNYPRSLLPFWVRNKVSYTYKTTGKNMVLSKLF
jgi:hypothetical protein